MLTFYSCNNPKQSAIDNQMVDIFDLNTTKVLIQKKTDQFTEAHITKDTAFLNSCFAKDARVFPPNSKIVEGHKDIALLNSDWVSYGIIEFKEESTAFYGNNSYVIDEGNYYLRYGEEEVIDEGKYINIWKNIDGEWKLYSNIWNTNLPQ